MGIYNNDVHFAPFVGAVARVSLSLLAVKEICALVTAQINGAAIRPELWNGFLPMVEFGTDRESFVHIVGASSIATSIAALVGFLCFGLRSTSVIRRGAWAMGFVSVFELITADALLNMLHPPRISTIDLVITTVVCLVGMATAFMTLSRTPPGFVSALRRSLRARSASELGIRATGAS
ncbi:MAG: hypothetical protein ACK5O2_09440 [Microthrixaceae bacterium]